MFKFYAENITNPLLQYVQLGAGIISIAQINKEVTIPEPTPTNPSTSKTTSNWSKAISNSPSLLSFFSINLNSFSFLRTQEASQITQADADSDPQSTKIEQYYI